MTDETKHSPEPWLVSDGWVEDAEGLITADPRCGSNEAGDVRASTAANARRIVACVNACAGIPTAALEAGRLGQLFAQALAVVQIVAAGMPYCGLVVHAEDLGPTLRALGKSGPGVSGKDGGAK